MSYVTKKQESFWQREESVVFVKTNGSEFILKSRIVFSVVS